MLEKIVTGIFMALVAFTFIITLFIATKINQPPKVYVTIPQPSPVVSPEPSPSAIATTSAKFRK